MQIKKAAESDSKDVLFVENKAFGPTHGSGMSKLVKNLLKDPTVQPLLSLVAVDDNQVIGHPDYYPRHGFKPAGVRGFEACHPIPDENADAWMVNEIKPSIIGTVKGKIICADISNQPEHWRE